MQLHCILHVRGEKSNVVYLLSLCVRTAKVLKRLCVKAVSSRPSLVAFLINTKFSFALLFVSKEPSKYHKNTCFAKGYDNNDFLRLNHKYCFTGYARTKGQRQIRPDLQDPFIHAATLRLIFVFLSYQY